MAIEIQHFPDPPQIIWESMPRMLMNYIEVIDSDTGEVITFVQGADAKQGVISRLVFIETENGNGFLLMDEVGNDFVLHETRAFAIRWTDEGKRVFQDPRPHDPDLHNLLRLYREALPIQQRLMRMSDEIRAMNGYSIEYPYANLVAFRDRSHK